MPVEWFEGAVAFVIAWIGVAIAASAVIAIAIHHSKARTKRLLRRSSMSLQPHERSSPPE
jgi:hypothetical protein